jgi:hypothetical protein
MIMNHFDQASRFAAKLDARAFLRWLLNDLAGRYRWYIVFIRPMLISTLSGGRRSQRGDETVYRMDLTSPTRSFGPPPLDFLKFA